MATSKIESKTQRLKLLPRREPYWVRLEEGFFLGYRKIDAGDGTWIARLRIDGKQKYHALGTHEDADSAQRAARAWRKQLEQGVSQTGTTVAQACEAYHSHIKITNGAAAAQDAEGRFKRLVYSAPIGKIQLAKLKTTDVRKWLHGLLVEDPEDEEDMRRSKDSANRNLAALKAALNLANKDRLVASDSGWKTVTPFRGVGRRREHMLGAEARAVLLAACPADLQVLVKAMLLTAARPGELAAAVAGDFSKKHGTLVLDGKTGRRIVTLSTVAKQFFTEQAKDKLPTAPLLATAYGKAWGKDDWKKPFKEAVHAAKLPADVVLYTLRHTAISEMILGGMNSGLVAMLAGTSTAMIDKHYGHLQHEQTRAKLDRIAIV